MTALPKLSDFEYRSQEEINGWPIIHINLGTHPETGRPRVAKGVVAIGNIAFGIVSIGAAAFGIVALGAFGLGIVSLAAFSLGIIAFGAVAMGYEFALGTAVLSAQSAIGLIGIDLPFVVGSIIFAAALATGIRALGKFKARRLRS